jgi:hypothetical protein
MDNLFYGKALKLKRIYRNLRKPKGDLVEMKRTLAFCILVLCSMLLLVNIGTIKAADPGYSIIEYWGPNPVTVDGKWTDADEWHDVTTQRLGTPQVAIYEFKMVSPDYVAFNQNYLIEFADSTNDAGDRWQICVGAPSTATAPGADQNKFEIEGHTTLKTYVGSGTAWTSIANPEGVSWKDSLNASPHDPATHYILEFIFNKSVFGWGAVEPPNNLRIAMYDASKPAQGWVSWPPTSTDTNPNSWGQISGYESNAAPEGLTIGLMMLLSSVAAVVSIRYFRKPTKL